MASEKKTKTTVELTTKEDLPENVKRVFAVVEDSILGSIMTRVVRDSTDYILNKEMTKLADDVMK